MLCGAQPENHLATGSIEHKMNMLIRILSDRRKVDHSATLGLMRELKLISKATWALELLGGEPFDLEVAKSIGQISEERNAYARYKWKEKREDDAKEQFSQEFSP